MSDPNQHRSGKGVEEDQDEEIPTPGPHYSFYRKECFVSRKNFF